MVPHKFASLWTSYQFQDGLLKGIKITGGYFYTGSQPVQDFGGNPSEPSAYYLPVVSSI
ncbi:MAG: hypothetical protein L0Y57_08295 [Beijerinckiaceae bacterium]|nr:hypothetical protein [Beijerinckiaceae bacterium]